MKDIEYSFHPLTLEIKDYFVANPECDFISKLDKLFGLEALEIFPHEPDDCDVIIVFKEKGRGVSCVLFGDGVAAIDYNMDSFHFTIDFSYEQAGKLCFGDFISDYDNYALKGRQRLLCDILQMTEDIKAGKVFLEYIGTKKVRTDKLLRQVMTEVATQNTQTAEEKAAAEEMIANYFSENEMRREMLKISRLCTASGKVIARSKKWKEKFLSSPKLKTVRL